jgi:hypothetical protein
MMPSITSWTRLEPRTRSAAMSSLAARVADPPWMLARQWQLGELQGEDAGSPVDAELRYTTRRLSRFRPALPDGTAGQPLPTDMPLEVLVEAEPPLPPDVRGDLRAALAAGQRFLDLLGGLAGTYRAALTSMFGLLPANPAELPDPAAARLRALAAGRVPDGRRLYTALHTWRRSNGPAPVLFSTADVGTAGATADTWLTWYEQRTVPAGASPPAWQRSRLEYQFAVGARDGTGEVVLAADSYNGERLDWHALDVRTGTSVGATADSPPVTTTVHMLPVGLTFPGMPASRWWQLEDGDVDLTLLHPAPEDLGRLLFTEFAISYGNDFFQIPVELDLGTLTSIDTLRVTTTFGDVVDVPLAATADASAHRVSAERPPWRMFQPTVLDAGGVQAGAANLLVMLPTLPTSLDGDPVEEVLLSRDEMANIAWAVEQRVPGPSGLPVDRHELWQRSRPDPPPADDVPHDPALFYRLATSVPPYWLPLVNAPGPAGSNRLVMLTLASVQPPVGTLVDAGLQLFEERLPRTGVRLLRHPQRTRWSDGTVHVWMSRRTEPGTGESTSGLRFDDVEAH